MKNNILILGLFFFAAFNQTAWAVNADSLGGMPWHNYLRSDACDTAFGPTYFNLVSWFYGYADPGMPMMQWDNNGNGILGYNRSNTAPLLYGVNETNSQPWMELRADSNCPSLISLHGKESNALINSLLVVDQIGIPNGIGIGVYNGHDRGGTGIYVDHGGDKMGVRIENNEWSTGYALWIDNCNTGTALDISDLSTGRIIHTSQDLPGKPAITLVYRASLIGLSDDSSMCYWWGFKGHKAEVETVKTALCGLRGFGNGGLNICDTIIAPGVAESTTVVTANYAGGFESATCNPLRIKVGLGYIIVKRGATTDPERYYWQATMMMAQNQIQLPEYPPTDSRSLGFSLFPNPSTGQVFASYALPRADRVQLSVYNMLGQKVRTITDGWQPPGYYTVQWDGKNEQGWKAAAGVYLYQLKAAGCQETQKIVMVK